jgi:hypothetical protein
VLIGPNLCAATSKSAPMRQITTSGISSREGKWPRFWKVLSKAAKII